MRKADPFPSTLSTVSVAPMSRQIEREMASPSPVPPNCLVVSTDACSNASKIASRRDAGMPIPVSSMQIAVGTDDALD